MERFGMIRLDRQRAVATGEGLVTPLELGQTKREVGQRFNRVGVRSQCGPEETHSFFVASLQQLDRSEQVERIELIGLCFENLLTQMLRLEEPSLLKIHSGTSYCLRQAQRFLSGGRRLGHVVRPFPVARWIMLCRFNFVLNFRFVGYLMTHATSRYTCPRQAR